MTVSTDGPITASGHNALINNVNKWFGDIYSSNTVSDSKAENEYGWGNSNISDVNINDIITADQDNEFINRINLGVTQTGIGSPMTKVIVGEEIYASTLNNVSSNSSLINTHKLNSIDPASEANDAFEEIEDWSNTLSITATITFDSYAKARYYFNSGGLLKFQFNSRGVNANAVEWKDLFLTYMSYLTFSYYDITQAGSRDGTITSGSGFYELTTSPTEIYNILLTDTPGDTRDLTVLASRNATGNEIILTFNLDNKSSGLVDGKTQLTSYHKISADKSYTNPTVEFSIDLPTSSVLSAWTGS